jgi:hypothetical protein
MILVPKDDDACLCERGDVEGEQEAMRQHTLSQS